MADISQVNLPNDANNPYNIADATARSGLSDKMDKVNPTGTGSFSLNRRADTTIGTNSFAEGSDTVASGSSSHAEGSNTTARGDVSHAEGFWAVAIGMHSHAEGEGSTARGDISHAEGLYSCAMGSYSHAAGCYSTANHRSQHVFGEYNALDDSSAEATARGNYVEIVGNGTTPTNRSNARTLDWSGNEVLSGTIEATGFGTTLDREVDRGGVQLTQAQYDALVSAGTVDANTTYYITDGQNITTASAVTYNNTTSELTATNVQDAIDEIVFSTSKTLTYDGVSFVFKKRGYFVEIACAHSTTKTFPTTWTSLTGTLPSSYFPSSDLYIFLGFPNGYSMNIRLINGTTVQLRANSNDSMYAQGSTIYMI